MSYEERIEECKELLRHSNDKEYCKEATDTFTMAIHDILRRTKDITIRDSIREVELARHIVVFSENESNGKYIVKNSCNLAEEEDSGIELVYSVKIDEPHCVLFIYSKNNWDTLQEERKNI